jgi:PAS domain-containing protein
MTIELPNYRKNGEEFSNELTINPETDANGEVIGFVGIVIDATARRRSEAKSRGLEARLTSIVENMPGLGGGATSRTSPSDRREPKLRTTRLRRGLRRPRKSV